MALLEFYSRKYKWKINLPIPLLSDFVKDSLHNFYSCLTIYQNGTSKLNFLSIGKQKIVSVAE